jgi:hypothetical protein
VTGGNTVEAGIALTDSGSLEGRILLPLQNGNGNGNGNGKGHGHGTHANGSSNGYLVGDGKNGNGNGHGHADNGNKSTSGSGSGNILVELAREGETRRTISDRHGRFLFEQLVPGEWTLKIYGHNLPKHHYLENGTRKVMVAPGERGQVTVQVLPRLREIRFIDKGRIQAE